MLSVENPPSESLDNEDLQSNAYSRKAKRRSVEASMPLNTYSHSVSSWLAEQEKHDEELREEEERKKAIASTKKFYDDLDDFSLEEEEVVQNEEGEVIDTKPMPAEPTLSLDLTQLHAQSTAELVDDIMLEELARQKDKVAGSYLDDFVFEEDEEEETKEQETVKPSEKAQKETPQKEKPDEKEKEGKQEKKAVVVASPPPSLKKKLPKNDSPQAIKEIVSPSKPKSPAITTTTKASVPKAKENKTPEASPVSIAKSKVISNTPVRDPIAFSDKTNMATSPTTTKDNAATKRIAKRKRSLPSQPLTTKSKQEEELEQLKKFIQNKENTSDSASEDEDDVFKDKISSMKNRKKKGKKKPKKRLSVGYKESESEAPTDADSDDGDYDPEAKKQKKKSKSKDKQMDGGDDYEDGGDVDRPKKRRKTEKKKKDDPREFAAQQTQRLMRDPNTRIPKRLGAPRLKLEQFVGALKEKASLLPNPIPRLTADTAPPEDDDLYVLPPGSDVAKKEQEEMQKIAEKKAAKANAQPMEVEEKEEEEDGIKPTPITLVHALEEKAEPSFKAPMESTQEMWADWTESHDNNSELDKIVLTDGTLPSLGLSYNPTMEWATNEEEKEEEKEETGKEKEESEEEASEEEDEEEEKEEDLMKGYTVEERDDGDDDIVVFDTEWDFPVDHNVDPEDLVKKVEVGEQEKEGEEENKNEKENDEDEEDEHANMREIYGKLEQERDEAELNAILKGVTGGWRKEQGRRDRILEDDEEEGEENEEDEEEVKRKERRKRLRKSKPAEGDIDLEAELTNKMLSLTGKGKKQQEKEKEEKEEKEEEEEEEFVELDDEDEEMDDDAENSGSDSEVDDFASSFHECSNGSDASQSSRDSADTLTYLQRQERHSYVIQKQMSFIEEEASQALGSRIFKTNATMVNDKSNMYKSASLPTTLPSYTPVASRDLRKSGQGFSSLSRNASALAKLQKMASSNNVKHY